LFLTGFKFLGSYWYTGGTSRMIMGLKRTWINTELRWLCCLKPSCVQGLMWPWFQVTNLVSAGTTSNSIRSHFCWLTL